MQICSDHLLHEMRTKKDRKWDHIPVEPVEVAGSFFGWAEDVPSESCLRCHSAGVSQQFIPRPNHFCDHLTTHQEWWDPICLQSFGHCGMYLPLQPMSTSLTSQKLAWVFPQEKLHGPGLLWNTPFLHRLNYHFQYILCKSSCLYIDRAMYILCALPLRPMLTVNYSPQDSHFFIWTRTLSVNISRSITMHISKTTIGRGGRKKGRSEEW